ncbi:Aliphatic amidase regulator [Hartmannibacter diazotrophicus]|uniref:Aliphatic amidase regulator n=1 Tax=Hartmannibacter diazotrophicus TaxID=1482074 RepID=A0A2C9D7J5_9HYPH|nr:Aliphatic amidase regulator [Hartmannibacter diazotrophicus]
MNETNRTGTDASRPSSGGVKRLLDDLRQARVLVIHPQDEEGEALIRQLRRIGCDVRAAWPVPAALPANVDTVFVLIDQGRAEDVLWRGEMDGPTVIAILDYESPTSLKALVDWNAHGVVTKPVRASGILSSLVLARYQRGYQDRLLSKVRKLEETLKARREIERASKVLMRLKGISDHEAYQLLRTQATSRRVPIAEVAASVIAAAAAFEDFGLTGRAGDE